MYRNPTTRLAALMACLMLAGCQLQPAGQQPQESTAEIDHADLSETANEQWFVILLAGERIGWGHESRWTIQQKGEPLLVTRQQILMSIERGGDITDQQLELETITTAAGELREFSQTQTSGPSTTTVTGRQVAEGLRVKRGETTTTIPWNPDHGGFFSVTRSLLQAPLRPGESRTVTELTPQLLKASEITLTALQVESIATPGGVKQLLKVQRKDPLPTGELISWMWIDGQGTVHAARTEGLELWQFLATQEQAMQPLVRTGKDLLSRMMVPVDRPLDNARQTHQVLYRLHLERPISQPLCSDSSQAVTRLDRHTFQIDVHPPSPDSVLSELPRKPTDEQLAASAMIQSSDAAIIKQAEQVLPDTLDHWQLALALEQHVHALIEQKDYSHAFATARVVLESRQGDCTEHAVLLAALCRARAIPTRIAVGLVYVPGDLPGYGYHMWNEVWIGDRWIGLDAMAGRGRVAADRIKILDTDMGDGKAHLALSTLLLWIGQGRLEILSAR